MSETKQMEIGVYSQPQDILSSVVDLIGEKRLWKGSASELSKKIGWDSNPRALAVALKKQNSELEKNNIFVKHTITRGRHLIILSNTPLATHNERNLRRLTQHIPLGGVAKLKEPNIFPFEWRYGIIEELSKSEKNKVNILIGKKQYRKTCPICGNGSNLEYRKVSDGNSSLLCKSCAEQYVLSALKLLSGKRGDVKR